jgi:hypothetical protein
VDLDTQPKQIEISHPIGTKVHATAPFGRARDFYASI